MPIYVTLYKFTDQGIKAVKESPARVDAVVKGIEGMGGKVLGFAKYLLIKAVQFNARRRQRPGVLAELRSGAALDVVLEEDDGRRCRHHDLAVGIAQQRGQLARGVGDQARHGQGLLPIGCDQRTFMDAMRSLGIQTSIHYPPIHTFSYYRQRYPDVSLPLTEEIARREVTLPLYPGMNENDVQLVVEAVKQSVKVAMKHFPEEPVKIP